MKELSNYDTSRIPVSYTHLDVYKRQVQKGFTNAMKSGVLAGYPLDSLKAVSYTHLDVYKRQE